MKIHTFTGKKIWIRTHALLGLVFRFSPEYFRPYIRKEAEVMSRLRISLRWFTTTIFFLVTFPCQRANSAKKGTSKRHHRYAIKRLEYMNIKAPLSPSHSGAFPWKIIRSNFGNSDLSVSSTLKILESGRLFVCCFDSIFRSIWRVLHIYSDLVLYANLYKT